MRRYTFVVIPDSKNSSKKYCVPYVMVKTLIICSFAMVTLFGYCITDYLRLRALRGNYGQILLENRNLKGEARILMSNLEDVKGSLKKVKEYTTKLSEITNLQTQSLSKHTGIGEIKKSGDVPSGRNMIGTADNHTSGHGVPMGIDFESLVFRPVFQRLNAIGMSANTSAFDLQKLISSLSQQKTLLASVPSLAPVDGWVTSGFGQRMSPFTGESMYHKGIDVAAPIGTPIYAPADGVVVFSGRKEGFGNFVMIAHGYGIVTGYGHNAQNLVTSGQAIRRGEQVATIGQTGRTTGPHLHYEIWVNGRVVDPKRFILNMDDLVVATR